MALRRRLKIAKKDKVKVIYGSDKGKTAEVLEVQTKKLKIRVQGVHVQTHFDKKEGLLKKEAFIDYSNVALVEKAKKEKKDTKKKSK